MRFDLNTLRGDIFGGIVAAVVALPLALAFGVASGLGPVAGLYGAIAVGFLAAVLGGTPTQISGPTGPTAVATAVIVAQHAHNLAEVATIVMLSGLLQVAFGLLRFGRYVTYTPYSVVSGFMSGIGVIIIILQTLPFLGSPMAGEPLHIVQMWPAALAALNPDALFVAVGSLALCVFWPRQLHNILPAPLVALLIGTLAAAWWFPGAPVIGAVPTGVPEWQYPILTEGFLDSILQPALILALVNSVDSLLTSLVADSMTRTQHNSDRELFGQGIGNIVAGLLGVMPGAGATMRTVVNVRAGGRTPLSGALHAIILLGCMFGLGPLVERIPYACLAGILMKVGWDIIDWRILRRIRYAAAENVTVMLLTLVLTVFVDLIMAVGVGLIVAGFVSARRSESAELKDMISVPLLDAILSPDAVESYDARVGLVAVPRHFSVASARELARSVGEDIQEHEAVIFDFSAVTYMDESAALVIEDLTTTAQTETKGCVVAGLSDEAEEALRVFDIHSRIPPEHFVPDLDTAKKLAWELVNAGSPEEPNRGST